MNNELLNIAAKTAESVIDDTDSLDILQLVSFKLDEIEYGIDILSVHEILRIPEITRLPNTPEYIKGVINLRGNVIPVVDIRLRFGMQQVALTELSRIIVVEIGEKLVGLLVDNVHQVIRLSRSRIDEPHDLIEGISTEFISGIGRLQDRLIVILRLDNILFSDEQ
ncbi:MAG: chemotaxis protein CheW [Spirochaetes bacterium]|nr:chemotaxis protein CheW [Spirochaetota bacterium]HOJ28694.1 chemotaxis protein CheW [Spirochaetota bacterium]HOM10264.1 chemotaxis protein CheW [Spirochaetota bacterium]HPP50495.1 chemotaxis protein CheW [Spirochaetota bacterium]HXK64695.1 chemotaxis protein CheW [Spirochaetota bacterium]